MPKSKTQNPAQTADMDRKIQKFPLSALHLHAINPRQEVTDEEIESLAQSINVVGLIQNLAGIEDKGRVGIVAGGRRLRALQWNAKAEKLDPDTILVPVRLAENDVEAQAWANAENVARQDLNPAAEVRAYAKMAENGAPTASIAKAFAVTVRHVAGRLKLAHIAPEILDALGAGDITLDLAAAFTVIDDHAAQLEAFKTMTRWYEPSPSQVRRLLTEETTRSTDRLAKFVGRERYEAAGGAVREDLFGDDVWFEDQETLNACAQAELDKIAKEYLTAGFKWVEIAIENLDYMAFDKFGRTYAEEVELSEEEAEKFDNLRDIVENEAADEAQKAAFAELKKKLDSEIWSDTQKEHSGVIVYVDHYGSMKAKAGLVRPEDQKPAVDAGICQEARKQSTTKDKGPYSAALETDLTAIRTGAVQMAMLEKPQLAFDLLTFVLSYSDYNTAMTVGIRKDSGDNTPGEKGGYEIDECLTGWRTGKWSSAEGCAKAFLTFRDQSRKEKNALVAEAVAKALSGSLAKKGKGKGNALFEMIAQLCEANVRSVWTPTTAFFKRLSASQLEEIYGEIMGETVSASFAKMKKSDKAARLNALFNEGEARKSLDAAIVARIDSWTPDGMAVEVAKKPAVSKAA